VRLYLHKHFSSLIFIASVLSLICSGSYLLSQTSSKSLIPRFDVAALHEVVLTSREMAGGGVVTYWRPSPCKYQPDRVQCSLTVRGYILEAWGIPFSQSYKLDKSKLPADRFDSKAFELKATMPVGTSKETARLMMRNFLKEKFGLKTHTEKRNMAAYALIVGRSGIQLRPAKNSSAANSSLSWGVKGSSGYIKDFAADINELAGTINLNSNYGAPVVNATGLTGRYQIDFRWERNPDSMALPSFADPNFLPALRKATGLTLEKRVLPIDILVVDAVSQVPLKGK
jgi:uncharacterized protein (TIGR03435 family)